MPFLDLESNIPTTRFTDDFVKKLCSSAAEILSKPEERINAVVKGGLPMQIGGSMEPCVILTVSAVSVLGTAEQNKEHSARLFQFLMKELQLSEDRIVLRFCPLETWQVGKKGTVMTFL
ncbi:D-dopachrome decarboxylase [Polypterus senegalus]|uniref:D-dopachrome decarboxylase n=1 Tax=Polypterus senegalus TaxID=55291 RepID=UPI001965E8E7|nr:D-dopachrome decarboxylase [Polypterus senegalus]